MNNIVVTLLLSTVLFRPSEQGLDQKRLLRDLFEVRKYNPLERPAMKDNGSVTVRMAFNVQQIVDMNEREQYVDSSVWIEEYWTDSGLVWNVADYGGIRRIRLPSEIVWRPDILMYNSAEEEFDGTWPVNVVLEHTGAISYIPPAILRSICKMNVRWFPFDQQYCMMRFGSWTYDDLQVNVTLNDPSIIMTEYIENGEFEITSTMAKRYDKPFNYDGVTENYPYVALCLNLRRQALYYYFNLLLPAAVISGMGLLVFTLPASSDEKIGLSVTILLSLTVFSMVTAEYIPRTSEAVPIIGLYFSCVMIICSVAVLTSVWIVTLHYLPRLNENPPEWVLHLVCKHMAKFLRVRIPEEIERMLRPEAEWPQSQEAELIEEFYNENETYFHSRIKISTVDTHDHEDSVLNAFEDESGDLVTHCECYHSAAQHSHLDRTEYLGLRPVSPVSTFCSLSDGETDDKWNSLETCCPNCDHMQRVAKELKVLSDKVHSDATLEKVRGVWLFASSVIDRACLCLFSSIITFALLVLLIAPPIGFDGDKPLNWPC